MKRISASIITIGDELLIGQVIDTNSAFIAQQLNSIGVWVNRRVAVGDVFDDIWKALDEEARHADIILITGGLGPTADDITKPLLCQYFNGKMIVNQEALENVQRIFANRGIMAQNLHQADVPDVCTVIQNSRGTAPGMWFEKDAHIFVSMPGVPFEMKEMVTSFILPKLKDVFPLPFIYHRTLLTVGMGESMVSNRIKEIEKALPSDVRLAYLPDFGKVRLRLSCVGDNEGAVRAAVDQSFEKLAQELSDIAVNDNGDTLEKTLGEICLQKNITIATAESCTAGNIAHTISTVPGASAYLLGGIVSYTNDIKHHVLHVSKDTLEKYTAVSEETVKEMVQGALSVIHADYAVAVSGILGPTGGTEAIPVGTVWIAVGDKNRVVTKKYQLRQDRQRNMQLTTTYGINQLRLFILGKI